MTSNLQWVLFNSIVFSYHYGPESFVSTHQTTGLIFFVAELTIQQIWCLLWRKQRTSSCHSVLFRLLKGQGWPEC